MKKSNEKENYKKEIIEMMEKVENPRFLRQIWTILKRHIERGED